MIKSRMIKMVLFVAMLIGGYTLSSAQQSVSIDVERDAVTKSVYTLEFSSMDASLTANLNALKAQKDPMFGSFDIDTQAQKVTVNCLYSDMSEHEIHEYFRTHLGLQPQSTKMPVNAIDQALPEDNVQSNH